MTSASAKPAAMSPLAEADALGDVGRLGRLRLDALGEQVVVQHRRVRAPSPSSTSMTCGSTSYSTSIRSSASSAMPATSRRPRRRHGRHTAPCRAPGSCATGRGSSSAPSPTNASSDRDLGEVGGGDDRLDAGQRRAPCGVDRHDPRMRVRAAHDLAPQHAGHGHVGAVRGAAGHLVDAVGTDRAGADDLRGRRWRCSIERSSSLPPLHLGGGIQHGADDLVVAGAAAQIAGEPVAHLGPRSGSGSRRAAPWPRRSEARRAEAALQRGVLEEFLLQRVQVVALGHALDRLDRRGPRPRRRASGRSRPAGRRAMTLQAPQSPEPQPSLLPVRPSSSRSTSSRVCCGSQRNSVGSPLMVVVT